MNLHFDYKEVIVVTMILFAVLDIIGSLPILLHLQRRLGVIHAEKSTLVSCGLMILFILIGPYIMQMIGIDIETFAIAGSFVIFFLAMFMILGIKFYKEDVQRTITLVPTAFPLIGGTGTPTVLLSLLSEYRLENIIIAILINTVLVYIFLRNTFRLEKLFGVSGVNISRKMFGIILLAVAIKLFKAHARM